MPAAELDRRFYALVLDLMLSIVVLGVAGGASALLESWWSRLMLVLAAVVALVAAAAVGLALTGCTPGKAALRLRVLAVDTTQPLDLGPAFLRTAVVALAGLPTFGFGLAALALTAVTDVSGRRRGWHDRVAGSVVVDARAAPVLTEPAAEPPRAMFNLTAARLLPAPDGATVAGSRPAPALPPDQTAIRSRRAAARWRLTSDTGESVVVEGLALVGRVPTPRAGEPVQHLLPLTSPGMTVSKTHAAIDLVDGVLVVTDRGSTNGSVLIRQGVSRDLTEDRPATLLDGDRVRFGDREFTVSREG